MEMGVCGVAPFIRIAKSRKDHLTSYNKHSEKTGQQQLSLIRLLYCGPSCSTVHHFKIVHQWHHGKTTRVEGLRVPPTHNLSQMEALLMDEAQRRRAGHRAQRGEAMRMRSRRSLDFQPYNEQFIIICITCIQRKRS